MKLPVLTLCGVSIALSACADKRVAGTIGYVEGFSGVVAADEPQAVLVAREILSSGGTAADAAVGLGFTLAVTYPVAAGLGGGGLCVAYDAKANTAEMLDFRSGPAATNGAAVPALARGLYALHARSGELQWGAVVIPAENLARFGFPISRALVQRVNELPPGVTGAYAGLRGVGEGQQVAFVDLAASIASIRQRGAGAFHEGPQAAELVKASREVDLPITLDALRSQLPSWQAATVRDVGSHKAHGVTSGHAGAANNAPASTGFVVADRYGNAAACVLSMGQPFGAGKVVPGLGFLLASGSSAGSGGDPMSAELVVNQNNKEFRFAAAAGGQGAQIAVNALTKAMAEGGQTAAQAFGSLGGVSAGFPARINVAACPEGIPPNPGSCEAASDPRGAGYGTRAGL